MGTETPHSIIAAAFAQLEEGGSVSLDSVARAVGLTKPGVMYHYPTKEALMLALVDSVLDRVGERAHRPTRGYFVPGGPA